MENLSNWRQFLFVCPVIDHKFRNNNVKVAVDPRGDSYGGFIDYFGHVMTKFIVNDKTDALNTDIELFFTMTNCWIARSRSLTRRMNYKFMCRFYLSRREFLQVY